MKKIIMILVLASMLLQANSTDEKVLQMLKQLQQQSESNNTLLPPPSPLSPEQAELAKKSARLELKSKETEMISAIVASDLTFAQKLPRAIGYTKISDSITCTIELAGKRFRLRENNSIAGWKVSKIDDDGVSLENHNGYSFKSFFDIK